MNIDPAKIAFLLVDEPGANPSYALTADTIIINWANAIKNAFSPGESRVRIWEDPFFSDPNDHSVLAPEMMSVCDVLCPHPFLSWPFDTEEQYFETLTQPPATGKALAFYSTDYSDTVDPYAYYRLQAWYSFQKGAAEMSFWAFSDQRGNPSWKTKDYYTSRSYSPLFIDPLSVTDGKGMEAIREGVEDYEYLQMLRSQIAALPAGTSKDQAQAVLDTAVNSTLASYTATNLQWSAAKDRTVADTQRNLVLSMLETLAMPSVNVATFSGTQLATSGTTQLAAPLMTVSSTTPLIQSQSTFDTAATGSSATANYAPALTSSNATPQIGQFGFEYSLSQTRNVLNDLFANPFSDNLFAEEYLPLHTTNLDESIPVTKSERGVNAPANNGSDAELAALQSVLQNYQNWLFTAGESAALPLEFLQFASPVAANAVDQLLALDWGLSAGFMLR